MIDFILQHHLGLRAVALALREPGAAVGMYWIFSAAVSSMPEPDDGGGAGYLWLYRFLHTIAGNITTAFVSLPGLKILIPLLLVPAVLLTTACAARYTLHPGALNVTDSAAYDTLLVAEAAIDQGRVESQLDRCLLPRKTRSTPSSGPTTSRGIRG